MTSPRQPGNDRGQHLGCTTSQISCSSEGQGIKLKGQTKEMIIADFTSSIFPTILNLSLQSSILANKYSIL